MTIVQRIAIALVMAGAAACGPALAADASRAEPPADELSSLQWRDCAGHFFFLSKMLGGSKDDSVSKKFQSWGVLAIYAAETKAKAEAAGGNTKGGLGKSLVDPKTGKLNVDVRSMVSGHEKKAKKQGQEAYVQAYSAQCAKPIQAYTQRFMQAMGSGKH